MRFVPTIRHQREAVSLYVHENHSLNKIAARFGCCQRTVMRMLDREGVERRPYTSTRICWCGAEVDKRHTKGKRAHETMYGTECLKHRLERHNEAQRRSRNAKSRSSRAAVGATDQSGEQQASA